MKTGNEWSQHTALALLKGLRTQLSESLWVLSLLRFTDLRWTIPPWHIYPAYSRDYAVMKFLRKTLNQHSGNQNEIILFLDLDQSITVTENKLHQINLEKVASVSWRLSAFLSIYRLEMELAQSFVPFTELADSLEEIIEQFHEGADKELLQHLQRLLRRLRRRSLQAYTSAILAIFSLYLLIPAGEVTNFVGNLILGCIVVLALFGITFLSTWTSFPPLLTEQTTVQDAPELDKNPSSYLSEKPSTVTRTE